MARTMFFPPKNRNLATKISIRSPSAFRTSIRTLKKGGLTLTKKRALVLARNRAGAQLHRKNLSTKERREMGIISRTKI